jgi:hypothetical protein
MKRSIRDNANLKKNPITTIIGIIITFVAVSLYVIPYFYLPKSEIVIWVPAAMGMVGIFLIISPDDLIWLTKKVIDKRGDYPKQH